MELWGAPWCTVVRKFFALIYAHGHFPPSPDYPVPMNQSRLGAEAEDMLIEATHRLTETEVPSRVASHTTFADEILA